MGSLRRCSPSRFTPFRILLHLAAIAVAARPAGAQSCNPQELTCITGPRFLVRAFNGTVARNGGKCLDYAAEVSGSPVFLNDCSAAHSIGVRELDLRDSDGNRVRNDVLLIAGTKVIGLRRPGASTISPGGPPLVGPPAEILLELQPVAGSSPRFGALGPVLADQTFALDGDSIILAADRNQVAKVQNGRGRNGTAIVLGQRDLAESEFWEFRATDGSNAYPTSAFVPVADLNALIGYLGPAATPQANFGTVFVVSEAPIILSVDALSATRSTDFISFPTMRLPAGVTVRGDRRASRLGPELFMTDVFEGAMFSIGGSDARISGLRIRGPNTARNTDVALKDWHTDGVAAHVRHPRTIVDHNDISDWTWVAVRAQGDETSESCEQVSCVEGGGGDNCARDHRNSGRQPNNIRVARNFLHHNLVQDRGYGVDNNSGGFAWIEGNTFSWNRHAIAGTNSTPSTGYRAWSNLVLTDVPLQRVGPVPLFCTHDFDMHGTGTNGFGGIAGGFIEIVGNTFLGTKDDCISHNNFSLRSISCDRVLISNNIFLQSRDDALQFEVRLENDVVPWALVSRAPPQFYPPSSGFRPTNRFGVGDFDGDGRQDLFLATGTAFYFSPGGEAEWRLLAGGRTDRIETLLFGDFDNDGRTDVVGKNGGDVMVSWGGSAEWERLNSLGAPITDLAAGNFDGVGGDDLFYADGRTWFVSSEGSGPWVRSGASSFRVRDLRFGDFNHNGTTDAFGVVSGYWSFSDGTTVGWAPLRPKLTDTVRDLIAEDFDGNGIPDIAVWNPGDVFALYVSYDARGEFTPVGAPHLGLAAVGHFRGDVNADILIWNGKRLDIIPVLEPPRVLSYSRGDMR
jgi:FG-GAP-like repeat